MQIQRPPLWVFKALGILRGLVPSVLSADVSAVVDVGQGGWGQAEWTSVGQTRTTNGLFNAIPSDTSAVHVAWIDFLNIGASAATQMDISLMFEPNGSVAGTTRLVHVDPIAANLTLGHAQLFSSLAPIVIPPGFKLRCQSFNLSATGNSHQWQVAFGKMPAGYKPF